MYLTKNQIIMNEYLSVLKQYAVFDGRARRREYWMFTLFSTIISVILTFIGTSVDFLFLGNIYSLAVLLPTIGVLIRRMHDTGKSGWFCLIPFYNLYLACLDSDAGQNEYGPNPKGIGNDEIGEIGKFQE